MIETPDDDYITNVGTRGGVGRNKKHASMNHKLNACNMNAYNEHIRRRITPFYILFFLQHPKYDEISESKKNLTNAQNASSKMTKEDN